MKDYLISSYIDDELDLDEKIVFVETVHAQGPFKDEAVDLLHQGSELVLGGQDREGLALLARVADEVEERHGRIGGNEAAASRLDRLRGHRENELVAIVSQALLLLLLEAAGPGAEDRAAQERAPAGGRHRGRAGQAGAGGESKKGKCHEQ